MINKTLYRRGMKGTWKLLLIFCAVLTMYFTIIISMYDPALGSALVEFSKVMPELMAMVGMNPASTSLLSHMAAYLYGFVMLLFPMAFAILCANKLIAKHVENGSMAYLLAAPVRRSTVVLTQLAVQATNIGIMVVYATVLSLTECQLLFPGGLEIGRFLLMNVGVLALHLFIGSLCFACACVFNESKIGLSLGAGVPALCFILQMAAQAGDKYSFLKYASFFTLYQPQAIALGDGMLGIAVLFAGAAALYAVGAAVFCKKDLYI